MIGGGTSPIFGDLRFDRGGAQARFWEISDLIGGGYKLDFGGYENLIGGGTNPIFGELGFDRGVRIDIR